jgi:hypothetical protein
MKKTRTIVAVTCLLALVSSGIAFAQAGPGRYGQTAGRMYNPKTVETLTGEVVAVNRIPSGKGRAGGVHLMLKLDKEEIDVHLGPQWYVDQQPMKVMAKDHVEVRGSRVLLEGKPVIIAAEVKKGDQVLKLRDDAGLPLWRGKGRQKY